jgi:8-oxo-dGTP pyrophosphatase MutT (NUDIX family)
MEYFDLYDRNFNKLDKKMIRGGHNEVGEYHLVVHIWIRNSEGKYLVQERNKDTDVIPHQWAATGGAVIAGETSIEGAIRETYEEIGVLLKEEDLILKKRYFVDHEQSNYITDLYLVEKDLKIDELVLDYDEVASVKYFTLDEIYDLIKQNKHWDYTRILSRKNYFLDLEKR